MEVSSSLSPLIFVLVKIWHVFIIGSCQARLMHAPGRLYNYIHAGTCCMQSLTQVSYAEHTTAIWPACSIKGLSLTQMGGRV